MDYRATSYTGDAQTRWGLKTGVNRTEYPLGSAKVHNYLTLQNIVEVLREKDIICAVLDTSIPSPKIANASLLSVAERYLELTRSV